MYLATSDCAGRQHTPLTLAVAMNNKTAVELLLGKGANTEIKSTIGTLLFEALYLPADEIAQILMSKGAHVNATDPKGATVLDEALKRKENLVKKPFPYKPASDAIDSIIIKALRDRGAKKKAAY